MDTTTTPARGRAAVPWLLAGMVALLALTVLDRQALAVAERLSFLLLVVAAVAFRPVTRTGVRVAAATALALSAAAGVGLLMQEQPSLALRHAFRYVLPVLVVVVAVLASAMPCPRARWHCGLPLLLALLTLFTASAFAGRHPKEAMELLTQEAYLYAGLFLLVPILARNASTSASCLARRAAFALFALVVLAMGVVVCTALAGGPPLRDWMHQRGMILVETEDAAAPWRILFPFSHHNRTAYFCIIACFAAMAEYRGRVVPRAATVAVAVLALVMLAFTATRGAAIAAVAGFVAMAIAALATGRRFRLRWIAVVGAVMVLAWLLLPEEHQRQFLQILSARSYQPGPGTSIGARLAFWPHVVEMIRLHPWLGVGYGFESFDLYTRAHYPDVLESMRGLSHAHNIWLETAAETGIPAALVLLGFTTLRVSALFVAMRRMRLLRHPLAGPMLVWLGLEAAIQVFGLSNYPLRRNLGMMTYMVWGVSAAFVMAAHHLAAEHRPPATDTGNPA